MSAPTGRPGPGQPGSPEHLVRQLRQRAWDDLLEQAEKSRPAQSLSDPGIPRRADAHVAQFSRDPDRHLAWLGRVRVDGGAEEPITLCQAADELRAALDDPQIDPDGTVSSYLVLQTLREFATRLLITRRRGELGDTDDAYARAISDLTVALSLRDQPAG